MLEPRLDDQRAIARGSIATTRDLAGAGLVDDDQRGLLLRIELALGLGLGDRRRLGARREPRALRLRDHGLLRSDGLRVLRTLRLDDLDRRRREVDLGLLRIARLRRGLRAVVDHGQIAVLVVGDLHDVLALLFFFLVLVAVVLRALGQDRAHDIGAEPRHRERRRLHRTTNSSERATDRADDIAHAQRRGDHDRDDQADHREQRRARRADHGAQDLREVLADRSARAVPRDAVARGREVHERRDRDDADDRAGRDRDRHHRIALEQRAHARHREQRDHRVAAHPGEAVEQPGGRPPERSHHQRVRLQGQHRHQQEQRGTQADDAENFMASIGFRLGTRRRTITNLSVLGH